MMDTIKVQVVFTEKTSRGEFTDALYFTQEDFAKLDPDELKKRKQERVDNWIYILENPVELPTPTVEDYTAELVEIERQKVQLDERKVVLTSLLTADEQDGDEYLAGRWG
jgi:hypothetical protein